MILLALFLRWCHLMWQLMKLRPHRAVDFFAIGQRYVMCTCGRKWR